MQDFFKFLTLVSFGFLAFSLYWLVVALPDMPYVLSNVVIEGKREIFYRHDSQNVVSVIMALSAICFFPSFVILCLISLTKRR